MEEEAQGCRVMAFDGISHNCGTMGSLDQWGNHLIKDLQGGCSVGS